MPTPIRSANSTSSTYPSWLFDDSPIEDPFGYGDRAVRFLQALKHPKSTAPLKAFQLDRWMERLVRRIYSPRNPDGTRVVSTVVLLIPRGNRKTTLAAALSLLHTIGPERVDNGEAILAAADRKQASIAFKEATGIVHESPRITAATKVYDAHNSAKKIVHPKSQAYLEIISGDAGTQHGRTPHFVLADELHVWPNRYLWEALTTGLDKVDNPLLVVATTAGRGQDSAAYEIIEDARKVARGEVVDPTILPVLLESAKDVDWRDEAAWHRANPGLAHGYPSIAGFRRHAARAERSMAERQSFLQLKLNVWSDTSTSPFVDMALYDAPANLTPFAAADFAKGQPGQAPAWIAADMSTTTDLTAVLMAIKAPDGSFPILAKFFLPSDLLEARADRDGVPYPQWRDAGWLETTPGNVIDYSAVEAHIRDLCGTFDVQEVAFDPAYAQPVMAPLLADGLPVVTMRQGWLTQSPALNVLERAIVGGNFRHGGNPLLRWCFANVAIHTDSAGNRVMHKSKSTGRIDGAVASWMAVSRAAAAAGGSGWLDSVNVDEFFEGLM